METSIRGTPHSRVARNLIACLLALALAAVVWPPRAEAWAPDDWVLAVRAEQQRALEETDGAAGQARALAAIRAYRFGQLARRVGPERALQIARDVPLLGWDPSSGRIVPVDPSGRPRPATSPLATGRR